MICNSSMKRIIESIRVKRTYLQNSFPIEKKINQRGQPFWCVSNSCGLIDASNTDDINLTDLEWDGNEIYLNDTSNIGDLVMQGKMEEKP